MIDSSEEKTGVTPEVLSVKDGIMNYDPDPKPLPIVTDSDYDKRDSKAQWTSQRPLGFQTILQFEIEVPQLPLSLDENVLVNVDENLFYGMWFPSKILSVNEDGTFVVMLQKNEKRTVARSFIRKLESDEEASTSIKPNEAILIKKSDSSWSPGAFLEQLPDNRIKVQINDDEGTIAMIDRASIIRRDEPMSLQNVQEMSSVELYRGLQSAYAGMTSTEEKVEMNFYTGHGGLVTGTWSKGSVITSWDGGKHVDINLFTYELEDRRLGTSLKDHFLKALPFLKLVARDEMPRGSGGIVNFASDLKTPPYWVTE